MITRSLSKRKNASSNIDGFSYTIYIDSSMVEMPVGTIPFNLHGIEDESLTLTVDWGDGITSTLTPASYPTLYAEMVSGSFPEYIHSYESWGIYTISLNCSDWSKLYFCMTQSNPISSSFDMQNNFNLFILRKVLVTINSPLPAVAGKMEISQFFSDPQLSDDSLAGIFSNYTNLTTVPSNLFINLSYLTDVDSIFMGSGITSLPSGLFNGLFSVTSAYGTFAECPNLTTIPTDLFYPLTALTGANVTFEDSALTAVPEDLFKQNLALSTTWEIFCNCPISTIPTNLFKYNIALTDINYSFHGSNVTNFTLDLSNSPNIEDISGIVDDDTSKQYTRNIIVTAGTATYDAVNSQYNADLNLTIQTV